MNNKASHSSGPGLTRRHFLNTSAAALAAMSIPSWAHAQVKTNPVPAYKNLISPDAKLRIAAIGVGGQGAVDIDGMGDEDIVALCDVDFSRGERMFRKFPAAARFRDYRQMFDEAADTFDAVIVATPDHTHFPAAMRALEAGKHIYVEKPLTHTIGEARILREAARKAGVITQMGNHGHANEGTRLVKEWIDDGALGIVNEVHCWTNRPSWPQGVNLPKSAPVPDTMDWNLWLGTAPVRDYSPDIAPFKWRGYWNYGCGAIGDMGCHLLDAPFWVLNLRGPVRVTAQSEGGNRVSAPNWSIVTYEYPARGSLPPLKLTWYEGSKQPSVPPELGPEGKLPGGGCIYRGDKGAMLVTGDYSDSPRLIPETRMKEYKRPEKTILRVPQSNARREWVNACKGGPVPGSNIPDHAAELTEMTLLGNLAIRLGKPIDWDPVLGICTGLPEAYSLIHSDYRIF